MSSFDDDRQPYEELPSQPPAGEGRSARYPGLGQPLYADPELGAFPQSKPNCWEGPSWGWRGLRAEEDEEGDYAAFMVAQVQAHSHTHTCSHEQASTHFTNTCVRVV